VKNSTISFLYAVALAVCIVSAYITSFAGVFLFDDFQAIFANDNVIGPSPVFYGHRWLVDLTFRLNLAFGGRAPLGFHALNLLIHVLNALLAYGILSRLVCRAITSAGSSAREGRMIGWATALIWGVHPLATQAVTYMCQRYESLTAFFGLAAIYFFLRAAQPGSRQRSLLNASLACLILGMGCKESMAVIPVLILALDYVFAGCSFDGLVRKRGLFHIASFATLLILLMNQLVLAAAQMEGTHIGSRLGSVGSVQYLYNQAKVIAHYIKLSVWPASLCFDYAWQPEGLTFMGGAALAGNIALFLVSGIGVVKRKKWALAVLCFYLLLSPTSSIVPVADLAVEHRMYLPLLLVVLLLVVGFFMMMARINFRAGSRGASASMIFHVSVVALAALLGLATSIRNMHYWSEVAMWQDVCTKRPDNLRARNDLAAALSDKGCVEEALAEYYAVIARIPERVRNRCDSGDSVVLGSFIKSSPEYAYFVACANIGTMYCNEVQDYDLALEWYLRALRIAPMHEGVRRSAKNILRAFGSPEAGLDRKLNDCISDSIRGQGQ